MNNDISPDPVPYLLKEYNNMSDLQAHRLAAMQQCSDSCNRINRVLPCDYTKCQNKCQELANSIIQRENAPWDTVLYNTPLYSGSYGNFGDYFITKKMSKEESLKNCISDCKKLDKESEYPLSDECIKNCNIDMIVLRDYDNKSEIKEGLDIDSTKQNLIISILIYIFIIVNIFVLIMYLR